MSPVNAVSAPDFGLNVKSGHGREEFFFPIHGRNGPFIGMPVNLTNALPIAPDVGMPSEFGRIQVRNKVELKNALFELKLMPRRRHA